MIQIVRAVALLTALLTAVLSAKADESAAAVDRDYAARLAPLFDYFHRNPELSYMEVRTSARLAQELRDSGFEVTEHVGKTGIVAVLHNGSGPVVMMRTDMDALPVEEKSGRPNASTVTVKDLSGDTVPVSHACGHDVHMTSLVGTAHEMVRRKSDWSGTLILVGQPAEERVGGARDMMEDGIWKRFGRPDYALAMHVISGLEAGKLAVEEVPYSGVDTIAINIRGVGTHGASPQSGKDPVVLGSQIVLALQTIISRERNPYEPAVITVGSFHAGTKSNIISDGARLELTVRSDNPKTREFLLRSISRVTINTARAFGIAESMLPEITEIDAPAPPNINNPALRDRLSRVWTEKLGPGVIDTNYRRGSMVAEDFVRFAIDPPIPYVYFKVGGTPAAELAESERTGIPVPFNHSPLFKVDEETAIKAGVKATVVALVEVLRR